MSMTCCPNDLLLRWQKQIGQRRAYGRRRPIAALGFLCRGADRNCALLDLRRLVLVVLFDEPIGRRAPALRLVGYGGAQIEHGVQWGGAENCKFYKDLRIEPEYGSSGLQLDASNTELLQLALQLRSELYRVDRFCLKGAWLAPQLPRVWAGFAPDDADLLCGDGPELAALCQKFDLPPATMLRKFQREHQGLSCYPLEWVSDSLKRSLAIFADLEGMPRLQVFLLPTISETLEGYQGAASYDFYRSRQRDYYTQQLARRQQREFPFAVSRITVACP